MRQCIACAPPQEKGFIADRNAARNRAMLWVLWDTGIRVGELCDLRLSNFDRKQGTLIVFGKGRKERSLALGRNALRTLLYYLDRWRQNEDELEEVGNPNEDHIFLSEGGQALTVYGIEMLFKRLRSRTGLTGKRISPHIFRHTFAVRYLMLGGDIFSLQELLGHEDISTIKNYMHLNDLNVQAQKRKFSPGDNVPFANPPSGRKQRTDFREPVKGKRRAGRGKKPDSRLLIFTISLALLGFMRAPAQAVGTSLKPSTKPGAPSATLLASCGAWTIVPSPNPGTLSRLFAVAGISASNVWAVESTVHSGTSQTLIEHWNGSKWSVVSSPNIGSNDILYGVGHISSSDVWAVGYYSNSLSTFGTLIEHWKGYK